MPTTLSARDFARDISTAKRAAANGPVFITDRGTPAHVLMDIATYRALTGQEKSLLEALADPAGDEFEFEPPRLAGSSLRIPDLG